jgi:hypothetical protein
MSRDSVMRLMPQIDPEGIKRKATNYFGEDMSRKVACKLLRQVKAIRILHPQSYRVVQSTHFMSLSIKQQQLARIDCVILP